MRAILQQERVVRRELDALRQLLEECQLEETYSPERQKIFRKYKKEKSQTKNDHGFAFGDIIEFSQAGCPPKTGVVVGTTPQFVWVLFDDENIPVRKGSHPSSLKPITLVGQVEA